MALTVYLVACVAFILVCLAMLWPVSSASRAVQNEIGQLHRDLNTDASASELEREQS